MKPIKFSWLAWGIGLLLAVLLGSFSSVNSDGVDGFFQSAGHAFRSSDVLLILCALLTVALVLWLIGALVTGGLSSKPNLNKRGKLNAVAWPLLLFISPLTLSTISAVVCAGLAAWLAWHLTRKHYQAKRVNDIDMLRGQLYDIAKWNSAEFPQYGAAAEDFHNQLQRWKESVLAGSQYDYPQLRGGDWFRQDLRKRFEKVPGVITMT